MIVGVLRESFQRERRVALVPALVSAFWSEAERGGPGGGRCPAPRRDFQMRSMKPRAPRMVARPRRVFTCGRDPDGPDTGDEPDGRRQRRIAELRDGRVLIGFAEALGAHSATKEIAGRGASLFAAWRLMHRASHERKAWMPCRRWRGGDGFLSSAARRGRAAAHVSDDLTTGRRDPDRALSRVRHRCGSRRSAGDRRDRVGSAPKWRPTTCGRR